MTLWTPLDCAAAHGWSKTVNVLLDFDSPVDPTDKTKVRSYCSSYPIIQATIYGLGLEQKKNSFVTKIFGHFYTYVSF